MRGNTAGVWRGSSGRSITGILLVALALAAPQLSTSLLAHNRMTGVGGVAFGHAALSFHGRRGLQVSSRCESPGERRFCRRGGVTGLTGTWGKGGDDDEGQWRLARSDTEPSSVVGKGVRALQKLLNKLEAKADKIEAKMGKRLNKWGVGGGGSEVEPATFKGNLAKVTKSPMLVVGAAGLCIIAVPAAMTAFAITVVLAQIVFMALAPLLITTSAALSVARPLIEPRILPAISMALTVASSTSAGLLAKYPTSRTLPALSLSTALPLLAWWVATWPVRTVQMVSMPGMMDPIYPYVLGPLSRTFRTDPFFRDLWQLLPRPMMFTTPTFFVERMAALPFVKAKIALSIASLLVVVYCWYTKREDVKKTFMPIVETLKPGKDASVYDVTSDEIEDEYKERVLREWETRYKLRPEAEGNPATWSADELAYQMETAGLGPGVAEAFRKGGIDGRVALTFTAADEDEIRDELGVTKLGERKRLLLFLEDLREMVGKVKESGDFKENLDGGSPGGRNVRPQS